MRIGALAKQSGLSRDTIRFYERSGLIQSAPSTCETNNYRQYPDDTVERLKMITEARDAGLSVVDLCTLLQAVEHGTDPDFDFERFLNSRITELENVIRKARKTRDMLRSVKKAIQVSDEDYAIAKDIPDRSLKET